MAKNRRQIGNHKLAMGRRRRPFKEFAMEIDPVREKWLEPMSGAEIPEA